MLHTLLRHAALPLILLLATSILATRLLAPHERDPSAAAADDNLCAQIPVLLAALDYTLATWPPETTAVPEATKAQLLYFSGLVRADHNWCTAGHSGPPPQLVSATSRWLFGNASELLVAYQQAATGAAPLASTPTPHPSPSPTPAPALVSGATVRGLHVVGNVIRNGSNQQIQMIGVNFSGAEYTCMNNGGHWDVPATQATIDAMKKWNIKVVRIPLNEDCWLGIHGITSVFAQSHRQAVVRFVDLLVQNNIVPIINLHFSGDGVRPVKEQEPMANRANSLDFWTSVATTFKGNSAVIFEPYNEPHLLDVEVTGGTAWECWRDGGCTVEGRHDGEGSFVVAGMQEMVNAIRATGAANIIIVTGENWGTDLSGWAQYKPSDPLNQLVAGWHNYNDMISCYTEACWNTQLAAVLTTNPIIATEIGSINCTHTFIDRVMRWLDAHNAQGYLAWTWGPFDCANDPALITDLSGTPTQTYGQGFRDHLLARP